VCEQRKHGSVGAGGEQPPRLPDGDCPVDGDRRRPEVLVAIFGDEVVAAAMIDRLVHHAVAHRA
jgi:hypothetical protein